VTVSLNLPLKTAFLRYVCIGNITFSASANPGHQQQARVALPALDAAHVGEVALGLERQLLPGEPALVPEPPYASGAGGCGW
jgi:hypothetical protein